MYVEKHVMYVSKYIYVCLCVWGERERNRQTDNR